MVEGHINPSDFNFWCVFVGQDESNQEHYKQKNIRLSILYFAILLTIQALAIYSIVRYNMGANPLYVFLIAVFIATILPIVLAVIIFGGVGNR